MWWFDGFAFQCGLVGFATAVIFGADAVILAPQPSFGRRAGDFFIGRKKGLVLASCYCGRRFWQLGGTLEGQGSSRRVTLGSGVGFLQFLVGFESFPNTLEQNRCFNAGFQGLLTLVWSESARVELEKKHLVSERVQTSSFRSCGDYVDFQSIVDVFRVGLGPVVMIFDSLETGLKSIDFHRYPGMGPDPSSQLASW